MTKAKTEFRRFLQDKALRSGRITCADLGSFFQAAVHKLLTRNEMYASDKAMKAVRAEGKSLLDRQAWLPETVMKKGHLIAKSVKNKEPIVMADLLTTSSVKH